MADLASKEMLLSWRRIAIVLIPTSAALGSYLLPIKIGGINFYFFRMLIIMAFILIFISSKGKILVGTRVYRLFFLLGYVWLLWGTASYFWAQDPIIAVTELLEVGYGFLTGFVLVCLAFDTKKGMQDLRIGWVFAFISSAIVAVWEIVSGEHLPGYFAENAPEYVVKNVIVSTFVNPNNYAAFLVLCFPFLLWSYSAAKGIRKVFFLLCLNSLPFLLIKTGGRLGITALILQLSLFLFFNARSLRSFFQGVLPFLTILVMIVFSFQTNMATLSKVSQVYDELQVGGSTGIRFNLLVNGIWFLALSYGVGVGAGGFEYMIGNGYGLYDTGSVINPHNFWIEVLSQYGIFVFTGLVAWLVCLIMLVLRVRKKSLKQNDTVMRLKTEVILVGLLGYTIATGENSAYINQPINWVFLGSVLTLATFISRPDDLAKAKLKVTLDESVFLCNQTRKNLEGC